MGSPLMASHGEHFYKRYVDDALSVVKYIPTATAFLVTLNEAHPAFSFTMEVSNNNKLPFIGMELIEIGNHLKTCVYRKTTNIVLLLHYHVVMLMPATKDPF